MAHQFRGDLTGEEPTLTLSGGWAPYWIGFLRVITGWWFFHAA